MKDVVITTNSPGEAASWVVDTAAKLKALGQYRVIIALVPCPYATGAEYRVLEKIPQIDLVLSPWETIKFTLGLPSKYKPGKQCLTVFLGGDLLHALILSLRLKCKAVSYVTKNSFWLRFFSKIAFGDKKLFACFPPNIRKKTCFIGDLSCDGLKEKLSVAEKSLENNLNDQILQKREHTPIVGMFPGSRFLHIKVSLGVFLSIAKMLKKKVPQTEFAIAVSPFVSKEQFLSALNSPIFLGIPTTKGTLSQDLTTVTVDEDLKLKVYWGEPYKVMAQMDLALTIPGTNTGEMAYLGKPFIVCLAAKAPLPRGGLGGLLEMLPFGSHLKSILHRKSLKRHKFAALPNQRADRMVSPEILIEKNLEKVVLSAAELLDTPRALASISKDLFETMGNSEGAHSRMAAIIAQELK